MHEIKIDRSLSMLAMVLAFGLLWFSDIAGPTPADHKCGCHRRY